MNRESRRRMDRSKQLGHGEKWLLPKGVEARRVVQDDRLIRREIYNPNPFPLRFTLQDEMVTYIRKSGIIVGPSVVLCKPDDFCILNHAFYLRHTPDGRPGEYLTNFGNVIGKGNKGPTPIE